jgi:hypothetical protein
MIDGIPICFATAMVVLAWIRLGNEPPKSTRSGSKP